MSVLDFHPVARRPLAGWASATPAQRAEFYRDLHTCRVTRLLGAVACRAALRLLGGLRIDGRENLPTSGPFVVVANHASHLDTLCLLATLPLRRVNRAYPAAASDYFFAPTHRARAAAVTVFLNALPFDRRTRCCGQSLHACAALLADPSSNNVVIVFPEGSRSPDGNVAPFKRGVGELVARRDVPVVPCRIDGAYEAWPRSLRLPRPWRSRLRVTIGTPLNFVDRPTGKLSAIEIADELREAVLALAPRSVSAACGVADRATHAAAFATPQAAVPELTHSNT